MIDPVSRLVEPGKFWNLLFPGHVFLNLDLNHLEHCLIIPIDSKIYILTSLCLRFVNCSKHLEPNNLPLWQFVTKLTYNLKCSNTRTTQYNKIPNYIKNPNLRLLTKKLPIRGKRFWSECICLSWNTQQTHKRMCGQKDI